MTTHTIKKPIVFRPADDTANGLPTLDFSLPPELEANAPPEARQLSRDAVRLLVSHIGDDQITHTRFSNLPEYLDPGDLVVINTSGTLNAALTARTEDGTPLEVHLSTRLPANLWTVELRRPSANASQPYRDGRNGETISLAGGGVLHLLAPYQIKQRGDPHAQVRLWIATLDLPTPLETYLVTHGFPIRYGYVNTAWPSTYYQTVYATEPGSAEMPSAGRAFTPELITRLAAKGVQLAPLVLHTGVASLEDHEPPYEEFYRVPPETAQQVNLARTTGKRVIARALNQSVDLAQALQSTLAQVAQLLGLETGWILLFDEHSGDSYLAASQNLPPALADDPRRMAGRCYCLDTFRSDNLKGAANVNVLTCSRLYNLAEGTQGLRYHASIPLRLQNRKLGVLNLASADWRELSEDDLGLLHTIGDLLSIAVERARLFERSSQTGATEERYRLARELHDTLGQGLTAVLLRLESVDALLEANADRFQIRRQMAQVLELTRANIEEARRSVLDLRAAPLEGQTLVEAIQHLADEYAQSSSLQIQFEHIDGQRPLPARFEAGLYRIAQEALNNIIRHAEARTARIELVATPDTIRLTIEDDGCGFTPDQIPADRYGLVGLNERARLLGGRLHIETNPGDGTRLEIEVANV